jgi:hypothetical protein
MSRERAKIFQMVADGTITPEEGERLLSRLDPAGTNTTLADAEHDAGARKSGPIKYLRVVVDGDDKVNIRVPIGLIRTGIKLTTLMPLSASEHLSEHGIDLSQFNNLDGEELIDALRELQVEVESEDGDIVRVFCE